MGPSAECRVLTCRVRCCPCTVVEPQALAGRIYSIDLMFDEERKDAGFEDFKKEWRHVCFLMPANFAKKTEPRFVPVDQLKNVPDQSQQPASLVRG